MFNFVDVDLIGSGKMLQVARITEAAHEFTLHDKDHNLIVNRLYGGVVIHIIRMKLFLERNDDSGFNTLSSFYYESYKFDCGLHIDRESLLEKKRCKLMFQLSLKFKKQL